MTMIIIIAALLAAFYYHYYGPYELAIVLLVGFAVFVAIHTFTDDG